jgi:hypothetical protein
MRPLNLVLGIVIALGLLILLGWTQVYAEKRRALKICVWTGAILTLLVVRWFAPFDVGPASWDDMADWIMPDGYARHSVETSISAQQNWIVGETKACSSFPLRDMEAYRLGKEPGYIAASINCDDGPMHTVTVNLYGRLILLCYKNPRRQQGQRGRERARWVAIWRRRVAMECGLCRSVRTGSASGRVVGLYTG